MSMVAQRRVIEQGMRGPRHFTSIQSWLNFFVKEGIGITGKEGMRSLETLPQADSDLSVSVLELLPFP